MYVVGELADRYFAQPLGRPLFQTQTGQWRALSTGSPVDPHTAFDYISRAFRQTIPYVIGALKLLAQSFTVHELNRMAWSLYTEFRPSVHGWGERCEVNCSTILGLRRGGSGNSQPSSQADIDADIFRLGGEDLGNFTDINKASPRKRKRIPEEDKVILDEDPSLRNADLDASVAADATDEIDVKE